MKPKRIILLVLLLLIVGGGIYFLQQWNKPHRDAGSEKGIVLTAEQLLQAYSANEHNADSLYLNKTIELSGIIQEWGRNDAHQPTVLLKSEDPMVSVFCTFKDTAIAQKTVGSPITVKGICSGLVGDVKLTDCVMK